MHSARTGPNRLDKVFNLKDLIRCVSETYADVLCEDSAASTILSTTIWDYDANTRFSSYLL